MVWLIYLGWLAMSGVFLIYVIYRFLAWHAFRQGEHSKCWIRLSFAYMYTRYLLYVCLVFGFVSIALFIIGMMVPGTQLIDVGVVAVLSSVIAVTFACWISSNTYHARNRAWRRLGKHLDKKATEVE